MGSIRIAWVLLAGLAVASVPTTGSAQQKEWDQAAVTGIAKELPARVDAIRDELRARNPTIGSGDSRDYYRFEETVRRIRLEARHLAQELENGKGHDQTLPSYEHILLQVRDARTLARRIFRTQQLMDRIAAARAVLDRLAPYYDAKPLPPPLEG